MDDQLALGAGVGLAVGLSGAALLVAGGAVMTQQGGGGTQTYEVRRNDQGRIMGVEQHDLSGGQFPALPSP